MNLYLRMFYLLIASVFKSRLPIESPKNALFLRVLPNDIDINRHMNNGRYLTICDLSRVDMFIRTGLAKTMISEKWMPVISEHTMTYKRPLNLFQKYEVKMEITGWDDKAFHMSHTFISGDRVLAQGYSKGCVLSKQGVIPPTQVIQKVRERIEQQTA
ncbi:thioesterase family protein [Neptunomonas antarctica]|uniref:Acyl-CoA thioesterase FadM n=1 Tax=Neptunomonas antarctica TaxID=619304 RepID=A0A1N7L663_9GAMM|nr:acyl-CoA thioesterase [Neptunomonas antarctica]SIS69281.1 Acyl-CoA thioesterase FadM [Neptunomonas antarctica]